MTFGERLKRERLSKGLTQQELANKLNVPRSTMAGYETKGYEPNFATLDKLSDILNVSVDYLIGRTNVKIPVTKKAERSKVDTIAAHLESDSLSDKDLDDIEQFVKFVKSKKK